MTKLKQLLVASFVLAVLSSPSVAGDGPCIVDDPTGTPLNVRSRPNGQISERYITTRKWSSWAAQWSTESDGSASYPKQASRDGFLETT